MSTMHSPAVWLQGHTYCYTHPIDLLELIYTHSATHEACNNTIIYYASCYTCPPSLQYLLQSYPTQAVSAQVAIINWAFCHILDHLNSEADGVADLYKVTGDITWDTINAWDPEREQAKIFEKI